jgi:maleate isomerase
MSSATLRVGVLTPHATAGPEVEFPAIAPGCLLTRVVRLGAGEAPTTPAALRALTAEGVVDEAAESLRGEVDAVAFASTTSAYAIGFAAESAMVARLAAQLDVPAVGTCAAAVRALQALGVGRVALIGAPWFEPDWNERGAAYFRSQGFVVVLSRSAALPRDPDRIDPVIVCEWVAAQLGDDAEGVFIGGNGFRVAEAVEPLEEATGRPVVTANQALLWNLLRQTGVSCPIDGYGRLFQG